MDKVLQSIWKLPDRDFQPLWAEIKYDLDGDFPQIWVDRPWHPLTKQEIYLLIWATKQLDLALPRLVLERIAFWIQLIDLVQDLRSGSLELQIVAPLGYHQIINWDKFFPILYNFLSPRQYNAPYIFQRGLKIEVVSWQGGYSCKHQESNMQTILHDMDDIYPIDEEEDKLALESGRRFYAQDIQDWMASRDRYRIVIPNRQKWDEFYELNFHL